MDKLGKHLYELTCLLLPVEIAFSFARAEVCTDIAVCREDDELVRIFDVVDTVAVLSFVLEEGVGVIYDIACALFVLGSGFVAEVVGEFGAVFLKVFVQVLLIAEFVGNIGCFRFFSGSCGFFGGCGLF